MSSRSHMSGSPTWSSVEKKMVFVCFFFSEISAISTHRTITFWQSEYFRRKCANLFFSKMHILGARPYKKMLNYFFLHTFQIKIRLLLKKKKKICKFQTKTNKKHDRSFGLFFGSLTFRWHLINLKSGKPVPKMMMWSARACILGVTHIIPSRCFLSTDVMI